MLASLNYRVTKEIFFRAILRIGFAVLISFLAIGRPSKGLGGSRRHRLSGALWAYLGT
jgi:hypothetical protein